MVKADNLNKGCPSTTVKCRGKCKTAWRRMIPLRLRSRYTFKEPTRRTAAAMLWQLFGRNWSRNRCCCWAKERVVAAVKFAEVVLVALCSRNRLRRSLNWANTVGDSNNQRNGSPESERLSGCGNQLRGECPPRWKKSSDGACANPRMLTQIPASTSEYEYGGEQKCLF